MPTAGLFTPVDKQWVIGTLKAMGSTDPDVLYAARAKLLAAVTFAKVAGVGAVGLGVLLLFLPAGGRWFGPPLLVVGWWLWRRGVRNAAVVVAGYDEYRSSALGARRLALGGRG